MEVQLRSEVQAVHGDTHLTAIDIRDASKVVHHMTGSLFVFIGGDSETEWLPAKIARDALKVPESVPNN